MRTTAPFCPGFLSGDSVIPLIGESGSLRFNRYTAVLPELNCRVFGLGGDLKRRLFHREFYCVGFDGFAGSILYLAIELSAVPCHVGFERLRGVRTTAPFCPGFLIGDFIIPLIGQSGSLRLNRDTAVFPELNCRVFGVGGDL